MNRFKGQFDTKKATAVAMNKARATYPGENQGLTYDEVQMRYRSCNKIYTENFDLSSGSNNDLQVNLPSEARYLIGISWYSPFDNDVENPTIQYELNNQTLINQTPVRALSVNNLQSQVFYPVDLPLTGQDRHIVDINAVGNSKVGSLIFHYI